MRFVRKSPWGALALGAAALALAGCDGLLGKPNVYKLPVGRAYEKLGAVVMKPSGTAPMGRLEIETTKRTNESVEWAAKYGMRCIASLKALEAEKTRVDVSCKYPDGSGGLPAKYIRYRVIELVDATLKDRPYDPKKADGITAAMWPADVVDHGTIGTAAAKALEMDRRVAEDMRNARR
jgi:hypothetical protein